MLPSASEIQYFVEVAQTQNISRAAERLGVTQPTLSLAIQKLEHAMGAPLLVRSKSGVRLTKSGQKFAQQARALLDQWQKIRAETLLDKEEARGRFTIGCHPSVALYALTPFLADLLQRHSGLEIQLAHDLSRRITEDVVSHRLDFGIVVNPVPHPDLVVQPLCKDEVTFWKAPKCRNEDVLICDPDLMQTQALLAKLGREASFARTVHSGNLEVITALVASGAGVGIIPSRVALREARAGLRRLPKAPVYQDRVALAYRSDMQRGAGARAVINAVRGAFGVGKEET